MKKILQKIIPLAYGSYFNSLVYISPEKTALKAFNLFCTNRKGNVLSFQKAYLDNAKDELHTVGSHKIQSYKWQGNKETVLLIHGWESNTFRWRNLVEKLTAANYNIIAFDAPGHGYSSGDKLYVPLYAEVLQFMIKKYNPKSIVAHSLGGMTVLYNEHVNKNRNLEKIVTIGSPSEFHEIMSDYQNILKFNGKVHKSLSNYIENRFGFTIDDFSSPKYVQNISQKGLLFHDKHDKIAPFHGSENVHVNWKNSELVVTEGLGHSMHQDEVNDKILAFLQS